MPGKVLEIAAPMVMGYVGKMVVQQKMDTKSLTGLLGGHPVLEPDGYTIQNVISQKTGLPPAAVCS